MTFRYQPGDPVEKFTGDYVASGEVRAAFLTKAGKARYVVEHTWPGGTGGFLHIYSEANLRPNGEPELAILINAAPSP